MCVCLTRSFRCLSSNYCYLLVMCWSAITIRLLASRHQTSDITSPAGGVITVLDVYVRVPWKFHEGKRKFNKENLSTVFDVPSRRSSQACSFQTIYLKIWRKQYNDALYNGETSIAFLTNMMFFHASIWFHSCGFSKGLSSRWLWNSVFSKAWWLEINAFLCIWKTDRSCSFASPQTKDYEWLPIFSRFWLFSHSSFCRRRNP